MHLLVEKCTTPPCQDIKSGDEEAAVKRAEALRDAGLLRGFGTARQVLCRVLRCA